MLNNGQKCETVIKGKNSTNMKVHLQTAHKEAFANFLKKKATLDNDKPKSSSLSKSNSMGTTAAGKNLSASSGTITAFMKSHVTWPADSKEACIRDEYLAKMLTMTSTLLRIVEHPVFKKFRQKLDPKYHVPGVTHLNNQMQKNVETVTEKLKALLNTAPRISIGMDIWTKKGYYASYMGISAAFYNPTIGTEQHAMLNLHVVPHPHMADNDIRKTDRNTLGMEY